MAKMKDLTGQRFGRLVVLRPGSQESNHTYKWICKCDCGTIKEFKRCNLRDGNTKSCGCYRAEHHYKTHGMTDTRLYRVWNDIKMRCYQKKHINYADYGGRGIAMCDEWHYDFVLFKDWAYENGYDETAPRGKCTIDRIDPDGNYEPSNCRWVNMTVQANNKRRTKRYEFNGEAHTLAEWSAIKHIKPNTLRHRIVLAGWPIDKALTEEVKGN